jgi:MoxR-like ATPase
MTTQNNHHQAVDRMQAIRDQLSANLFDRAEEANGLAVAYLAETNMLLLGPPGSAKSLVARMFAEAVMPAHTGGYFQRLLGAFTTPDEVFGPYNLPLLEQGIYERCTDGYLPTASFFYADEIFNANQNLLTTFNTCLEEGEFDQGSQRIKIPLRMAVGASNRYPEGDMAMEALYDRFLVRHWVRWVEDEDDFVALMSPSYEAQPLTALLQPGDAELLIESRKAVDVPETLIRQIAAFKRELAADGIECSTRRWKASIKLIQAQAVLNGNAVAQSRDCMILADSLWDKHEQRPTIYSQLCKHFAPSLGLAQATVDALIQAYKSVDLDAMECGPRGKLQDELRKGMLELLRAGGENVADITDELEVMQAVAEITDADLLGALSTIQGLHDNVARAQALGFQVAG